MNSKHSKVLIDKNALHTVLRDIHDSYPKFPITSLCSIAITLFIAWLTTNEYRSIGDKEYWIMISGNLIQNAVLIISILLTLSVVIYTVWYRLKNGSFPTHHFNYKGVYKTIMEKTSFRENSNIIILFPKMKLNHVSEEINFPVQKHPSWDSFFFPYIKISQEISKKLENLSLNDIKSMIIDKFNIKDSLRIEVKELTENCIFSSKISPESREAEQFIYRIVFVYSSSSFFRDYLPNFIKDKEKCEFMELNKMLDDKMTWRYNDDVIHVIQNHISRIVNELKGYYEEHQSKIIWNVEKKCNKGCGFCAFGCNREECQVAKKNSYLKKDELIKKLAALHIDEIDISMGCQADVAFIKDFIKKIKSTLPTTKINITANANVLKKIGLDFLRDSIDIVELTYDYISRDEPEFRDENESFNRENLDFANSCKERDIDVKIHTVWREGLTSNDIREIYNTVEFSATTMLLIRLMPVGNLSLKSYPQELLSGDTYSEIMNDLNKVGEVENIKYHCSLQGLHDEGDVQCCELCLNKLGISPQGDIYACPWAEHFQGLDKTNNPFYVTTLNKKGNNIVEDILNSSNFRSFINNIDKSKKHCKIFTFSKYNKRIFDAIDPIYK